MLATYEPEQEPLLSVSCVLYNVNFRARQPLFFFFCLFFCAADRQNQRITTPLKRQPKKAWITEFRFGQPKRARITEFRFGQPKRARITEFRFGQPKTAWITEFRFGQPKRKGSQKKARAVKRRYQDDYGSFLVWVLYLPINPSRNIIAHLRSRASGN